MSETKDAIVGAIPFKPAHPVRNSHDLPHDKLLAGHRVTVKGFYLARPDSKDKNGHDQKRRVAYEEIFELHPSEHRVHGQGALGHLLSDKILSERLAKKDPDFRAIVTHTIVKHENIFVDEPKQKAAAEEAQS